MCLDKIDKVTLENVTHGYKVFKIKDGKIYGELFNPDGTPSCGYCLTTPPYQIGKWYKAGDYTINKNEQRTRYTFVDKKEDTEAWCNTYDFVHNIVHNKVFKVKIDDIIALYPYMNYPVGFHTFLHKEDAEAWQNFYECDGHKILKVEVFGIVASGEQHFADKKAKTIVSKRMKIIGG